MIRIPMIYLETTIFNFPFVDDAPQYRADTLKLFAEIKAGKFKPFTSQYVIQEIDNTKDADKLAKMKALITDYKITIVPENDDIRALSEVYVSAGVIPAKFATDGLHIATATITGLDFIVSLNFRHIVKHKTIFESEVINTREGYKRVFIHTPAEVIDHE